MYVQGVSTRKVKAITEHLCGVSFSAPSISELERKLDRALFALPSAASRKTTPYLILDARYEKVREDGVTQSQAALLAIGINLGRTTPGAGGGVGQPREPKQWEGLPAALEGAWACRGGAGGLRRPCRPQESHPRGAARGCLGQRSHVHFLRNALDSLPRKADDDCLKGALLASPTAKTRRRRGGTWASWIATWQGKYPKLGDWVESNIEDTLTFIPCLRRQACYGLTTSTGRAPTGLSA